MYLVYIDQKNQVLPLYDNNIITNYIFLQFTIVDSHQEFDIVHEELKCTTHTFKDFTKHLIQSVLE